MHFLGAMTAVLLRAESQEVYKENFLRAMSSASRVRSDQNAPWGLVIGSIIALLVVVIAADALWRRRLKLRRIGIRILRRMRGQQVAKTRFPKQIEVRVYRETGNFLSIPTRTIDLSANGMYVKMNPPLSMETIFQFSFQLPDGHPIRGRAEVRWVQGYWSEFHPTGMGCKFVDLDGASQIHLRRYLKIS